MTNVICCEVEEPWQKEYLTDQLDDTPHDLSPVFHEATRRHKAF